MSRFKKILHFLLFEKLGNLEKTYGKNNILKWEWVVLISLKKKWQKSII